MYYLKKIFLAIGVILMAVTVNMVLWGGCAYLSYKVTGVGAGFGGREPTILEIILGIFAIVVLFCLGHEIFGKDT